MKKIDVKESELNNIENCYHLTNRANKKNINQYGLRADIGIRSDMLSEKTEKVFFTKSVEGTFMFINRMLNLCYDIVRDNNFEKYKAILADDNVDIYQQFFDEMVHDDMSEEEIEEVALNLGTLYLSRNIYYQLNLEHCTSEEFKNMTLEEQEEIDYLQENINTENLEQADNIHNMHTRGGRSIRKNQMELMTIDGSDSALDIVLAMVERYYVLNQDKSLPVLKRQDGSNDKELLSKLANRAKFKEISMEELVENALEDVSIGRREIAKIENVLKTLELNNETQEKEVSLDD